MLFPGLKSAGSSLQFIEKKKKKKKQIQIL